MVLLSCVAATLTFTLLVPNADAGLLRMQSEVTDCDPQLITKPNDGMEIVGTPCDDLIVADSETTEIDGGDGNDLIIGSDSVETLEAGLGDDTVYVNDATEAFGGADDDVIYGDRAPDPESKAGAELSEAMEPFRQAIGATAVDEAVVEAQGSGGMAPNYVGTPTNGNDVIYGEAGNDVVYALAGNDRVYGNIGDDHLWGQDGDDLLAGGHGADWLRGNDGDDTIRGDGTLDHLFGGPDTDTLSYASGVTPGFGFTRNPPTAYADFPNSSGERGVYVDLANDIADNGQAADGGGDDSPNYENPSHGGDVVGFVNIIGSPFSDYIVGDDGANVIDGGGGSDVILGAGGDDAIFGMAGGDNLDGGSGTNQINGGPGTDYCANASTYYVCNESGASSGAVVDRDTSKVAVGFIARDRTGMYPTPYLELYLKASTGADNATLTYTHNNPGTPDTLKFVLSNGTFDPSSSEMTDGCDYSKANGTPKRVICSFSRVLDMVNVAGLAGNDTLTLAQTGFPRGTNVIMLGNAGNDVVKGSDTGYDMLVDGPDDDNLQGFDLDDGLINNQGTDSLYAGAGSDLLLSTTLCEGDFIGGGGSTNQHNNASWAKLSGSYPGGVGASLTAEQYGERSGSGPSCSQTSQLGDLDNIQNLEGSKYKDALVGNSGTNKLLGRNNEDWLNGAGGNDTLTGWTKLNKPDSPSKSPSDNEDTDHFTGGSGNDTFYGRDDFADVSVDCGSGSADKAYLDKLNIDSFSPNACETVDRAKLVPND